MTESAQPADTAPTGRPARADDVDAVTDTLARAFADDPLWGWAFASHEEVGTCWRRCLLSAIPEGWVWTTPGAEAVTLWIRPGRPELTPEHEALLVAELRALMGDRADVPMTAFEALEAHHPRTEPHYYLSLLGTHPDHRGGGHGMRLLRTNLERIDSEHAAAYLESSNPANLERYASVGFEPLEAFAIPGGGPTITTMWRPAR